MCDQSGCEANATPQLPGTVSHFSFPFQFPISCICKENTFWQGACNLFYFVLQIVVFKPWCCSFWVIKVSKINSTCWISLVVAEFKVQRKPPIHEAMGKKLKELKDQMKHEIPKWSKEGCDRQLEHGLNEGCGFNPPPHILPYQPIGELSPDNLAFEFISSSYDSTWLIKLLKSWLMSPRFKKDCELHGYDASKQWFFYCAHKVRSQICGVTSKCAMKHLNKEEENYLVMIVWSACLLIL